MSSTARLSAHKFGDDLTRLRPLSSRARCHIAHTAHRIAEATPATERTEQAVKLGDAWKPWRIRGDMRAAQSLEVEAAANPSELVGEPSFEQARKATRLVYRILIELENQIASDSVPRAENLIHLERTGREFVIEGKGFAALRASARGEVGRARSAVTGPLAERADGACSCAKAIGQLLSSGPTTGAAQAERTSERVNASIDTPRQLAAADGVRRAAQPCA